MRNREFLVDVYNDTMRRVESGEYGSKIESEKCVIKKIKMDEKIKKPGITTVQNDDCINAALKLSNEGKTCLLNMASYKKPGGGVKTGAMAQEEELMRTIPDLFASLDLDAHNHNYVDFYWDKTIKYSKNLTVRRLDGKQSNGNYDFMDDKIPVNVITAAAPNLNSERELLMEYAYKNNEMMDKIKNLIKGCCVVPLLSEKEKITESKSVLILGAFGCGVFCPCEQAQAHVGISYPMQISQLFYAVLSDTALQNQYDEIVFAIPSGPNYDAFAVLWTKK